MKINEIQLGLKSIYIIDDIMPKEEIDAFYEYVKGLSFIKDERDDDYDEYPIFSVDFKPELLLNDTFVGKRISQILDDLNMSKNLSLYRSYVNMSHYGDVEFPHYDCPKDSEDITALYYVNNVWDYKWGGETLFYVNKDPKAVVLPTPGRLVVFPGNVEHLGGTPSRICKISRLSLALKYTFKNHNKSEKE